MRINQHTAILTNKVVLVPYCQHHVTTYHDWMKDPDIQAATASEPLTIDEEYAMQQSWRSDTDKLTFILCVPPLDGARVPDHVSEIASMVGDVNMFVSVHEEDDSNLSLVGEIELMVAVKEFQRRGLGKSALLAFLNYIIQHEEEIVKQYSGRASLPSDTKSFDYFAVKINENNSRSLALFEGVGFKKTSDVPSFFGEFELRSSNVNVESIAVLLEKYGLINYDEVQYKNDAQDGSVHKSDQA